jgi:dTDP-4-dehydrorhamnose reductase
VAAVLGEERPHAVVHAAVLGRTDLCEQRPEEAERVNVELPRSLARECTRRGARLVTLSTDLVFAGDRPFLRESDPPGPLSVYGRTKLLGEEAVLDACPAAAVVRLALVLGRGHGPRGTSTESVAWALSAGRPVRLFTDEHRTPVDAASVADAVSRLLESSAAGRFHLGGPERLSRHALGLRVASVLGLDASLVEAARQDEHAGPDRRPADVSLDATRARVELGFSPLPLDEAIREGRASPPAA